MIDLVALTAVASIVDDFMDWAHDAAAYGYWAIALIVAGDGVLPILPGETVVVGAAVLAADGVMNLWLVIVAGAVGAVIGDSAAFWIGRAGAGPIRRTIGRFVSADRQLAAERMVARQGPALVFTGRFLPGIRIAINLACGAGQMTYPRFLLFDSLGAVVWASQAALLGYFAGRAFAGQTWVAFVVAFSVTAVVATYVGVRERRYVRREKERQAQEEAAAAAADELPKPDTETPESPPQQRP